MGRKCFVPYCKSGYSTCHDSVTLFSCPVDPELMEKWSEAVLRQDRPLGAADAICEKHFREDDIIRHWRAFDSTGKEIMKVCLDEEMKVELYLKSSKLHCEEMNIILPKMSTVADVSTFVQSVDGLQDWK